MRCAAVSFQYYWLIQNLWARSALLPIMAADGSYFATRFGKRILESKPHAANFGSRRRKNRNLRETKMKSGLWSAAVAACGVLFAGPVSAQGVKIGILNDQSGVYADYGGKYSFEAAKMAVEDFGDNVLGRARHSRSVEANEEDRHRRGRGDVATHRRCLPALRLSLGLRYPCARGRHRRRAGRSRRRHLVLHDCRLRLRLCARKRHRRSGQAKGWQGAWLGPHSLELVGLLLVLAAGAELEGENHRARQCRPRHHQFDQAGGGIRHRQERPETRRSLIDLGRSPWPRA